MSVSCSICGRKLANIQSLTAHTYKLHPKLDLGGGAGLCDGLVEKPNDGLITFPCPTCDRRFQTKHSLSSHKTLFHTKRDTMVKQSEKREEQSSNVNQNKLEESGVGVLVPADSDNNAQASGTGQTIYNTNTPIHQDKSMLMIKKIRIASKRLADEMCNSDRGLNAKRTQLVDKKSNNYTDNHDNTELAQQIREPSTAFTSSLSMLASYKIKRDLFEDLVPRVFTTEQHMKSTMSEEQFLLIEVVNSVYSLIEVQRLLSENRELLSGIINHIETTIFMNN